MPFAEKRKTGKTRESKKSFVHVKNEVMIRGPYGDGD